MDIQSTIYYNLLAYRTFTKPLFALKKKLSGNAVATHATTRHMTTSTYGILLTAYS